MRAYLLITKGANLYCENANLFERRYPELKMLKGFSAQEQLPRKCFVSLAAKVHRSHYSYYLESVVERGGIIHMV